MWRRNFNLGCPIGKRFKVYLFPFFRWRALQGALTEYREHLAGALEIHAFNRDVDDTSQRVAEKAVAMGTEDTGRDLAAVQQLQRKQDALERDMTAIEGKIKVCSNIIHEVTALYLA